MTLILKQWMQTHLSLHENIPLTDCLIDQSKQSWRINFKSKTLYKRIITLTIEIYSSCISSMEHELLVDFAN